MLSIWRALNKGFIIVIFYKDGYFFSYPLADNVFFIENQYKYLIAPDHRPLLVRLKRIFLVEGSIKKFLLHFLLALDVLYGLPHFLKIKVRDWSIIPLFLLDQMILHSGLTQHKLIRITICFSSPFQELKNVSCLHFSEDARLKITNSVPLLSEK